MQKPHRPLRLVRFVDIFLWPIQLSLQLQNNNSLPQRLFLAIGQGNCFFVDFWLQLFLRAMLLPIFTMKWNLEALLDHLDLVWVVKSQSLTNPLLDHLFVMELTLRWCVVYFEQDVQGLLEAVKVYHFSVLSNNFESRSVTLLKLDTRKLFFILQNFEISAKFQKFSKV